MSLKTVKTVELVILNFGGVFRPLYAADKKVYQTGEYLSIFRYDSLISQQNLK